MSFLGDEITRQLKAKSLNVPQLAERTKISASQIYNWVRGVQISISEAQLNILAPALSKDIHDHVSLVHAHLLDEKVGPGSNRIKIIIDSDVALHDKPRPQTKGEKAFQFLSQERLTSRQVENLIIDLARVLGADI